jgi:hypothetical protein
VTSNDSLTGIWNGLYSYPKFLEPVYFVATLISHGQGFSGSTHEAQYGAAQAPLVLFASVSGQLLNLQVSFLKTYDGSNGWSHSVSYEGQLNPERTEIEGSWTLPSNWTGRFLMIRGNGVEESVVRKAYAKV